MTGWLIKEVDAVVSDVESWLGVEEKVVVNFLKPIIQAVAATGKTEILGDIATAAPALAAAFATGGEAGVIAAATTLVSTTIKAQAIQLGTSTVTALGAALAASAIAAAPATPTATIAPVAAS